MTGATFDMVIIACSVLFEPKPLISSVNTRTRFYFWRSAALFFPCLPFEFTKEAHLTFSAIFSHNKASVFKC
jgi:hypothetical protein